MLRLAFAFGIAGLFSAIAGNWKWKEKEYKGPASLGIFILIYCISSTAIAKGENCDSSTAQGKILLGQNPLEDAKISLPDYDYETFSNGLGEFLIQWNAKNISPDSILIQVQANGIDTSMFWQTANTTLDIRLKDTLVPISKLIIHQLIAERTKQLHSKMQGNYLKWRRDTAIGLPQLLEKYAPFELSKNYYRNEFLFESLENEITFRKNLIAVGIDEVEERISPYEKHEFDSCKIFILKYSDFPDYHMDYVMCNSKPVEFNIDRLQHIADNHYKASVSFKQNIRDIRVSLECSRKTNNYKIRQMEVYGFLPLEEYELKFKHGNWAII